MPSRSRAPTMRALVARRQHRPCRVIGCTGKRDRTRASSYCRRHDEARRRYGHEQGRRIFGKEYAQERKEVRALFDAYPDHVGVRHATEFIADWMRRAGEGRDVLGTIHVARLHRYEVDPRDVLIETCALFLFAWRNPHALPSDARLTWHLGISMLFMVPRDKAHTYRGRTGTLTRYVDPGATVREAVGLHLRQNLARLYANVAQTIEQQQQLARDAKASLGFPFTTNQGATQ